MEPACLTACECVHGLVLMWLVTGDTSLSGAQTGGFPHSLDAFEKQGCSQDSTPSWLRPCVSDRGDYAVVSNIKMRTRI